MYIANDKALLKVTFIHEEIQLYSKNIFIGEN